jgi:NTP pyrophosphatase (non-canonical NTP hydrolase)
MMNQIDSHQEECLNILQEECAEVIQAASNIKRFGIIGKRQDSTLNNIQNLTMELGDVLALVEMVQDSMGITTADLETARLHKMERLSQFMHTWEDRRKE